MVNTNKAEVVTITLNMETKRPRTISFFLPLGMVFSYNIENNIKEAKNNPVRST
ncbi:MAG: hypothetical protein PF517_10090 [Salinivirgaceae bacterium]|nr:hypothetical protein [Salinivirgaceae bacterium]